VSPSPFLGQISGLLKTHSCPAVCNHFILSDTEKLFFTAFLKIVFTKSLKRRDLEQVHIKPLAKASALILARKSKGKSSREEKGNGAGG